MDDFSDQISKILSDPKAMEQIRSMAGMFGSSAAPTPQRTESAKSAAPLGSVPSPEVLSAVSRIMPLLSEYRREDNGTRLLAAIRPFLSGERQKRLDEATKMLQIMRLLPMIKKFGGVG